LTSSPTPRISLKKLFLASVLLSSVMGLVEHTQHLPAMPSSVLLATLWGVNIFNYRAAIMAVLAALAALLTMFMKAERKAVLPIYALGFWLLYLSIWGSFYLIGRVMDGGGWIAADHPLCRSVGYVPWPIVLPTPFLLGPLLLLIARWLDLELSRRAHIAII